MIKYSLRGKYVQRAVAMRVDIITTFRWDHLGIMVKEIFKKKIESKV